MPIKPGAIEKAIAPLVHPFASLKTRMLYAMNEPRISPPGFNLPYRITPEIVKKLHASGVLDPNDASRFAQLVQNEGTKIKAFHAVDPAHAKLAENILHSFVVRNGKQYVRNLDSNLNSLRKVTDPGILSSARATAGNDPMGDYFPQNMASGSNASTILANALKSTGAPIPKQVIVIPGGSLFSKPSSIESSTGKMYLNNPLITTPIHELFHAKDYSSGALKKYAPIAGSVLSKLSLAGTPISILYGNEMSKIIPGTVDDKIINAFKYAGPEMYLAGAALQHSPEFYAVKNTKRAIGKNPKYFEGLSGLYGMPNDAKTLSDVQDMKARTYPSGILTNYGLLRMGTLPLYLAKQSSVNPTTITAKDYGDVAKGILMQRVNSIKGFFQGARDPEIIKGLLYHDSANKYKPVSSVIPAAIISAMVPSILLGEYFSHVKKPKPAIPAPAYSNDIKQGLGA